MYKIVFKSMQTKSFNTFSEMCSFCALSEKEMIEIMQNKATNAAIKSVRVEVQQSK